MQPISFSIQEWAAWAPGVEVVPDWQRWAHGEVEIGGEGKPDVSFVPANLRRRLSMISRMALYVANQCSHKYGNMRTIFASRHGEIQRTVQLLATLAENAEISPMGFSLSVHNTGAGLNAIATGNTAPASVVAALDDSFTNGLIEAAGFMRREDKAVLLVMADDETPSVYAELLAGEQLPYALAMVISPSERGGLISLGSRGRSKEPATSELPVALQFLRWFLIGEQQDLRLTGNRLTWSFSRNVQAD